ncbi:MAG TPA: transposase [Candidatus Saccharimonadales bacterium]|nr:transposase [Candidatus Saccharimonadales bacterium]
MVNINPSLTPALEAYLIALIYRNTRTSCLSLAALCALVSHDRLNRLLHSSFPWSRRLWELFASRMIFEGGYLVLDDTTWQRQTKCSEAVAKVWSSTAGGVRLGMQVVLLIWTDGQRKIPVSMRLWQKGGKSKIELAQEMLSEAAERGISPKYGLFDSWYTAKSMVNLLSELGWKYVARIKSNRLIDGERLSGKWPQRFGQVCGHLKQVAEEVRLIKDGKRYWVTNALALKPAQIKRQYRSRQQIEETFRMLKQEFGWGGSSARKAKAQTAHLHLGLMALCLTQHAAITQGETVYAFKRKLFRQLIPTELPFLEHFLAAA